VATIARTRKREETKKNVKRKRLKIPVTLTLLCVYSHMHSHDLQKQSRLENEHHLQMTKLFCPQAMPFKKILALLKKRIQILRKSSLNWLLTLQRSPGRSTRELRLQCGTTASSRLLLEKSGVMIIRTPLTSQMRWPSQWSQRRATNRLYDYIIITKLD
jgi:hypothetical protein